MGGDPGMTEDDDLPPSALLVKFYLEALPYLSDDPPEAVPREQIQVETGLNPRTARYACQTLEQAGIIEPVADVTDPNRPTYRLAGNNCQPAEVKGR